MGGSVGGVSEDGRGGSLLSLLFTDGGSYFQRGSPVLRDPNKAPKSNSGGGMPPERSRFACKVILLFAARLVASNGPGTWLPYLLWCGQVVRKNRDAAAATRSSETQTWSGGGSLGRGTAR